MSVSSDKMMSIIEDARTKPDQGGHAKHGMNKVRISMVFRYRKLMGYQDHITFAVIRQVGREL